jgi:hypothetical protein
MAKSTSNIITIDLGKWITQDRLAKSKGITPQAINNAIRKGKLKAWQIKELNIVLVENQ